MNIRSIYQLDLTTNLGPNYFINIIDTSCITDWAATQQLSKLFNILINNKKLQYRPNVIYNL